MADFSLTGGVVKADVVAPFVETTGQSAAREVVIAGTTSGGNPFEAVLRIQRDDSPVLFDPLASAALNQQITLEVTM